MSAILNLSNKITLSKNIRERISESEAGFIRSELTGAITYSIDCDFPLMSYNDFLDFQGELLSIDNGVSFFYVSIPEKAKLTPFRGSIRKYALDWQANHNYIVGDIFFINNIYYIVEMPFTSGSVFNPLSSSFDWAEENDIPSIEFVTTGSFPTSGSTVSLANVSSDSFVKAGDFIQFGTIENQGKVYQVKQDSFASNTGFLTFTLTQGVVKDILSTDIIFTGSNVKFKTKLSQNPSYTSVPKSNNENLYLMDSITLIESL